MRLAWDFGDGFGYKKGLRWLWWKRDSESISNTSTHSIRYPKLAATKARLQLQTTYTHLHIYQRTFRHFNMVLLLGLIGSTIRAISGKHQSSSQPNGTYHNQPGTYMPDHYNKDYYPAPQRRSGCHSRKWERRAERHHWKAERALLRAEHRAERDLSRAQRRRGCCGRRKPGLITAAAPVLASAVARVGQGTTKAVDDGYLRDDRARDVHVPQMQGRVDREPKMELGAGASGQKVELEGDVPPPAYEEVLRKQ